MQLEIIRTKQPYSAHGVCEIDDVEQLKRCPFCDGRELEIVNTHTASYWVRCRCGAEMHGAGLVNVGPFKTIKACRKAHNRAIGMAVDAWNERP